MYMNVSLGRAYLYYLCIGSGPSNRHNVQLDMNAYVNTTFHLAL